MFVQHIDKIIMALAGVWASLLGFGYFKTRPGSPPWAQRMVPHLKWLGPLLILLAAALAAAEDYGNTM